MATTPLTYSEDIEELPATGRRGQTSRLEDTILMENGWPHMGIDFDIRVDLDERCREMLKDDLRGLFGHFRSFRDEPKRVIISRPTSNPNDSRIIAVIRSQTGRFLGSVIGEANGTGMLTFNPASS